MNPLVLPFIAPTVQGLTDEEQNAFETLIDVWQNKRERNVLRQQFVDMKQGTDALGVDIPDHLKADLDIVMGWPSKAVSELANRIIFDGFVSPTQGDDPFAIGELLHANSFDLEVLQATESALTQSVAFWVTVPNGPNPLIRVYPAEWSAAVWDWGKREIAAGLTITQGTFTGLPEEIVLFLPGRTLTLNLTDGGTWEKSDEQRLPFDHVPMRAMPFDPSLLRPFGRSRVNRQVMSLTKRAIRAGLRMDVSSEFFMAPFYMLLGADESVFLDESGHPIPLWDWVMGNVKAISRDANDNLPEIFQSKQQDMTPYIEQMRQLAAEFSSAASIPVSSLGVVDASTNSSLVFEQTRNDLITLARKTNRVFGSVLAGVARDALMIRDGATAKATEYASLAARFRNPAMPSIVSQSDAMVKQVAAIPWLADTTVALEEMGYSDEQITRLQAEKRRAEGGTLLDRLAAMAPADRVRVDDLGQTTD